MTKPERPNRPVRIKPLANGAMEVTLANGKSFQLNREDEEFQAYVVFKMLQG